jgi:PD-(D/E)XK endonuclease
MNSRKMMSNCKRRGEWAELQFMAKASKLGLRVSKPWGDLSRYDVVVGTTGRFVSVQIKSTIVRASRGCYVCGTKPGSTSRPYQLGEFDFLAAYIIAEDVWYIIPAKVVVHGKRGGIRLNPSDPNNKYAQYKEAWHLLR